MFGLGSKRNTDVEGVAPPPALTTFCASALSREPGALEALHAAVGESQRCDVLSDDQLAQAPLRASYVLSLFIEPSRLDALADRVIAAREGGAATVLIIAIRGDQLSELGAWLHRRASGSAEELAIAFQHHASQIQVEGGRLRLVRPEQINATRGVIGHRILNGDLPVRDARIDDLEAGHNVVGGLDDVGSGHARAIQVAAQDECHFGLCTRLDQTIQRYRLALGVRHAGGKLSEIRLIDTH